MAHFIEQYVRRIERCDDYDMLASEISTCIERNIVSHISTYILEAIDRLSLNTSYHKFVKTMVWAVTTSDHTESSLNILRYFCNKITKEYDSLMVEPDEFSLMVITICADDKSFLTKVTDDRKFELFNTLASLYMVRTREDKNDPELRNDVIESMNLILNGRISMQELDHEFGKRYGDIKTYDIGTSKAHKVNEIIRPFQALFINIVQNMDQMKLLNEISLVEWMHQINNAVDQKAKVYEKKFHTKNSHDVYKTFLHDLIFGFKSLNDELVNTGYTNIENPVVGKFILNFLRGLHQTYIENKMKPEELVILIRDAKEIYYESYAVSQNTKCLINNIVIRYCDSNEYEDALNKGEYLNAMNSFLRQDEAFKLWATDLDDMQCGALVDRVIATYRDCYINDKLCELTDEDKKSSIATEAIRFKRDKKKEDLGEKMNEEKTIQERNDDNVEEDRQDNDEENSEDDQDRDNDREIEAYQSNKGYKRASKLQSDSERKIYKAYKTYKDNEAKVDSQLSKMLSAAKRAFSQDKTEEIIEGKKFTPIGLLKKILVTAAVFNYSVIAGFIYLIVSHTISKKRTAKQKKEILIQIETELKMLDEKIEDARGDGNRKAKYALMRTKTELERARDKIRYNLTATKEDMRVAKSYINNDRRDNL